MQHDLANPDARNHLPAMARPTLRAMAGSISPDIGSILHIEQQCPGEPSFQCREYLRHPSQATRRQDNR
jgi:hypothetical protein